jgi:transposase
MRYELTDFEWAAIKTMLPNKPRGVPRVDDRRVLNGIFWVLRSGAPWRDLPRSFGPYTTCYNRFVRWRRAGIWDRIMDALITAHDATVQMIDTVAGLMLAAISIPGQLATARLARMPPETELYAFAAGSLAFAAFGANRFMSVAADCTIAPIFAGGLASKTYKFLSENVRKNNLVKWHRLV